MMRGARAMACEFSPGRPLFVRAGSSMENRVRDRAGGNKVAGQTVSHANPATKTLRPAEELKRR
jgi:hypothetical protein